MLAMLIGGARMQCLLVLYAVGSLILGARGSSTSLKGGFVSIEPLGLSSEDMVGYRPDFIGSRVSLSRPICGYAVICGVALRSGCWCCTTDQVPQMNTPQCRIPEQTGQSQLMNQYDRLALKLFSAFGPRCL